MTNISRRHHYIPQFFIKGFILPLKNLWVYDKKNDSILSSQKSPKWLFYEKNKNNIKVNGHEVDILESKVYKYYDDIISKSFHKIQTDLIENIEQQDYISSIVFMILITLHRIPANEIWIKQLTNNLISNNVLPVEISSIIDQINDLEIDIEDKNKVISSISAFINFYATDLLKGKQNCKIVDSKQTCFILSDNPIIFEKSPTNLNELQRSVIFPLTETRVYYGLRNNHYTFNKDIIKRINILLAIQSKEYFASTNKLFLEEIVNAYKIIKPIENGDLIIKKELFEMINTTSLIYSS